MPGERGRFPDSVLVFRAFQVYHQWQDQAFHPITCWETVEEATLAWARMMDAPNKEKREAALCRFRTFAGRLPWPLLMHLFPWPDLNLL